MPERWWISNFSPNEFLGGAEILGNQFCKAARLKYMSATKLGVDIDIDLYETAKNIDKRLRTVNVDVLFYNSVNCWSEKPKSKFSAAVCCENFKSEMESLGDSRFRQYKSKQWERQQSSISNADKIITLSEYEKASFAESGYDTIKIEPYIDLDVFTPGKTDIRNTLGIDEDVLLALYVGRNHTRKGFDIITDLIKKKKNVFFLCIGAGEMRGENSIGLNGMSRDFLVDCYRACDFLLMPTRYESFGYVFAEAMACGKPILSTQTGLMADDIYRDCGITTTEISVRSFSDMIDFFSATRPKFDNNRKIAEKHFSFERFRSECNDVLGDWK